MKNSKSFSEVATMKHKLKLNKLRLTTHLDIAEVRHSVANLPGEGQDFLGGDRARVGVVVVLLGVQVVQAG